MEFDIVTDRGMGIGAFHKGDSSCLDVFNGEVAPAYYNPGGEWIEVTLAAMLTLGCGMSAHRAKMPASFLDSWTNFQPSCGKRLS